MTWYSAQHNSSKQLDSLIQQTPKFSELLGYSDFLQHLKSYNTKLLDYLSNSPELPKEIVEYLAVAPSEEDQYDRKYKLPLMTIQAVESDTLCILNSFFKTDPETSLPYLLTFFRKLLAAEEVLPLLAGYFFRVNDCLLKSKTKETVECLYMIGKQQYLKLLLKHPYNMAIVNVLQIYLNLDTNKCSQSAERTQINVVLVGQIFERISQEFHSPAKSHQRVPIIQNLTYALLEIIDKYFLLPDGKLMMDVITSEKNIRLMAVVMLAEKEQSYPVMSFFLTILRYYSCSSYNTEQVKNQELSKKNLERLESLPLVNVICEYFKEAIDRVTQQKNIGLYQFRLLEVFCHSTSLISYRIFQKAKETRFYEKIIDLVFRNESCSILHMLIERAFMHIFVTDKKIYQLYKRHLFCELGIIDLTAGRVLGIIKDKQLAEARKYGFFGSFMRIVKIYSAIQTFDEDISNAIKSKSDIWSKTSKQLIKPSEAIANKDLGSYNDLPYPAPLEFTVTKNSEISPQRLINNDAIVEEVNRQEAVPILTSDPEKKDECMGNFQSSPVVNSPKFQEDNFFQTPLIINSDTASEVKKEQNPKVEGKENSDNHGQQTKQAEVKEEPQIKRSESFKDFMNKQKIEVGNQIKSQRSLSYEKKISSQKTRLMSPSPKKKNSWKEDDDNENQVLDSKKINQSLQNAAKKMKIPKNLPKLPVSPRVSAMGKSWTLEDTQNSKQPEYDDRKMAKSMMNMNELRNIKIEIVKEKPVLQRNYRRMNQDDKLFLMHIGILSTKSTA